jgi:hypothetical protein
MMTDVAQDLSKREADLCDLAQRLEFGVEKCGERFTLTRTTDVSTPVRELDLTLDAAEELLVRWKLRGLGGG